MNHVQLLYEEHVFSLKFVSIIARRKPQEFILYDIGHANYINYQQNG